MVLKSSKRSLVLTTAIAVGLACMTIGVVAAQGGSGPSQATEVSGPTIGPAGQSGELHYLENQAKDWDGTSTPFGPYRLLPPGTKFIERPFPEQEPAKGIEESSERARSQESALNVEPPSGFIEKTRSAMFVDGEVMSIGYVWTSGSREIDASVDKVFPEQLPLDVYLTFDDSPFVVKPTQVGDHFVIVQQLRTGPSANQGWVASYDDGVSISLHSPTDGEDALTAVLSDLLARTPPLTGK